MKLLSHISSESTQFLAAQNSMAALIGGKTVHHWGSIPVNAKTARDKSTSKAGDGDVDALFERVLGCRWLVVDECSTLSLTLLGLLDSYLRRACARQPFASAGKARRPFGGLNVIFVGDFCQLDPPAGVSLSAVPKTFIKFKKEASFFRILTRRRPPAC